MKRILCIALAVVLSVSIAGTGSAVSIDADSAITGPIEEKKFSNATMEDDFAENQVIVIMTNTASLKFKEYTASDFPEIACSEVRDLMPTTTAKAEAKEKGLDVASLFKTEDNAVVTSDFYDIDTDSFRQILCLTLTERGKENVLTAIKALENRTDVYYAGPDYVLELCTASS